MSRVAVVYFSQTGNTETMAHAVAEGAGVEAVAYDSFGAGQVADYDALAFGCPAMGAEELDPDFEELWDDCVGALGERPVALFGSYDWGTGEWMDTWRESAEEAGVTVVDTVIANLEPDDETLAQLKELGARLAQEG